MWSVNVSGKPHWWAFPGPMTVGKRKQFRTSMQRDMSTLTCSGIILPGDGSQRFSYSADSGERARRGSNFIHFPSVQTSFPDHHMRALRPRS
eukprot:8833591-Pyramimonas_sp.AAC.2